LETPLTAEKFSIEGNQISTAACRKNAAIGLRQVIEFKELRAINCELIACYCGRGFLNGYIDAGRLQGESATGVPCGRRAW